MNFFLFIKRWRQQFSKTSKSIIFDFMVFILEAIDLSMLLTRYQYSFTIVLTEIYSLHRVDNYKFAKEAELKNCQMFKYLSTWFFSKIIIVKGNIFSENANNLKIYPKNKDRLFIFVKTVNFAKTIIQQHKTKNILSVPLFYRPWRSPIFIMFGDRKLRSLYFGLKTFKSKRKEEKIIKPF